MTHYKNFAVLALLCAFTTHSQMVSDKVAPVMIQPGEGQLQSVAKASFEITLATATSGAEIRYDLFGDNIDTVYNAIYTAPIPVTLEKRTAVGIMAYAFKAGLAPSDTSGRYFEYNSPSGISITNGNDTTRGRGDAKRYSPAGRLVPKPSAIPSFKPKP